jgi:hypothetical protein
LLDNARLRQQLTSLERSVSGTRETVSHPNVASAHDDVATAVCGALVAAGTGYSYSLDAFQPGFVDHDASPPPAAQQREPVRCNGDWWKSMPRSQPTFSADERLRDFYQSLDVAFKSGFFR